MGRKCRAEQLVLNCKTLELEQYEEKWNVWFRDVGGVVSIWNEGLHGHKELFTRITSRNVIEKNRLFIDMDECGLWIKEFLVSNKLGNFTGGYKRDGDSKLPEFVPNEKFAMYVENCA